MSERVEDRRDKREERVQVAIVVLVVVLVERCLSGEARPEVFG